jgi:BirA family biotin operon repressor/biotin-[acetyl-CoA-carboxylase] ligase
MHGLGSSLRERVEAAIRGRGPRLITRVIVAEDAPSTQDLARRSADGRPGLAVFAERQSSGRGRLGRAWTHGHAQGIAATFVFDAQAHPPALLSLASGLAAARAIQRTLAEASNPPRIGLRWPNDVVETLRGRKLAGVLIECADGLACCGIGINVLQNDDDWPAPLRGKAVSIRALCGAGDCAGVAERLIAEIERAMALPESDLVRQWQEQDVLVGATAEFSHAGRRIRGRVLSIQPTHDIAVETPEGRV